MLFKPCLYLVQPFNPAGSLNESGVWQQRLQSNELKTAVEWKKSHKDIYTLALTRRNHEAHSTFAGSPAMFQETGLTQAAAF